MGALVHKVRKMRRKRRQEEMEKTVARWCPDTISPKAKAQMHSVGWFLLTVFSVSTIQWTCVQFMATFCSTWGWFGPITNMVTLGSPVCHTVNKVQIGLAEHYMTIWISAVFACLAVLNGFVWRNPTPQK